LASPTINTLVRRIRLAALAQDGAAGADGELIESFISRKDEAAFALLLRRHGPMVLNVCRRVIGNHHDAEDAFQATFLVLAQKAASVSPREKVASWLHGVAYRIALKARQMRSKTHAREKQMSPMPEPEAAEQSNWGDLRPLLDEELSRLPENYRLAIVLCDLEGKSIKTATKQLGWPQGTLAGRLARARKLLAKRLTQRGVVLSAGSLAAMIAQNAVSASVSPLLMSSTLKVATLVAAGKTAAAGMKVAALTEGVLKTMFLTRLKMVTIVALVLGMGTLGGVVLSEGQPTQAQQKTESRKAPTYIPPAPSRTARTEAGTPAGTAEQTKVKYAVAELVVPIQGLDQNENKTKEEWLIGKIVRTIAPGSWKVNGGVGTIQYASKDFSLTVTNSAAVQAQVKALLETMRRVQDVEVVAETKVISLGQAEFHALRELLPKLAKSDRTVLSDAEALALIRKAGDRAGARIVQAPKITFYPGQRVRLSFSESEKFEANLTAHVAVNLQHIDLDLKARIGKTEFVAGERLIDGATLVQVKRAGDRYFLLLVTPRVVLNVEASPAGRDATDSRGRVGALLAPVVEPGPAVR
jgi:RNA polymerase sigma factor (sigma-70 family)